MTRARTPIPPARPVRGREWLRLLAGFLVIWGALALTGALDATGRIGLLILAVTVATAALVEVLLHGTPPRLVLRRLGFGRPGRRAMVAAAGASLGVLAAYPLFALATGLGVALRPDWPWLLLGVYAFHGLGEELAWRGYTFSRLRVGRSFWAAVGWTMPLVALTHVPILVSAGPVIGGGALALAAVTTIPLAHLYELGGRTIWAPALVHAAIDSFKLVTVPEAGTTTFSLVLVGVSLLVPLLVLLVRPDERL